MHKDVQVVSGDCDWKFGEADPYFTSIFSIGKYVVLYRRVIKLQRHCMTMSYIRHPHSTMIQICIIL